MVSGILRRTESMGVSEDKMAQNDRYQAENKDARRHKRVMGPDAVPDGKDADDNRDRKEGNIRPDVSEEAETSNREQAKHNARQ